MRGNIDEKLCWLEQKGKLDLPCRFVFFSSYLVTVWPSFLVNRANRQTGTWLGLFFFVFFCIFYFSSDFDFFVFWRVVEIAQPLGEKSWKASALFRRTVLQPVDVLFSACFVCIILLRWSNSAFALFYFLALRRTCQVRRRGRASFVVSQNSPHRESNNLPFISPPSQQSAVTDRDRFPADQSKENSVRSFVTDCSFALFGSNIFFFLFIPWSWSGTAKDYRCEDGRFQVSASCVTISNPDSLSSSDTGVNPGIRRWRKHSSDWARCQKAIGGIYFTNEWIAETLQPGLEFDNFEPRLKCSIFKCFSLLKGSFCGGDDRGFLK